MPKSRAESSEMIAGWGNLAVPGRERLSEQLERASAEAVLCRGLGRSYGDSSLPPAGHPEVLGTRLADRIVAFDQESGRIRAEAGLSLFELNRLFLRRGWFVPVTPGTQFVTLGGMVAADVHGKNHHVEGCFGSDHVLGLKMRLASGELVECGPEREPELFTATCGGMGLLGHVLEVEFELRRIPSPWIASESRRIGGIDQFLEALKDASARYPYVVGWIDCLSRGPSMGRGILDAGRWATAEEAAGRALPTTRRLTFPMMLPSWALGRPSVRAFNTAYYWKHAQQLRRGLRHPDSFFYPLDMILHWNRMYGRRGFTQYQCVIPAAAGAEGVRRFLELLSSKGGASFLAVIKDCGAESRGILSFPLPGISIALDIAVRDDTQALVDTLNEALITMGGRIYLAKDAFTRAAHFRAMEPRLERFLAARARFDPARRIRSAQSVRLLGDRP
ncbi:MAG: FAD-binding oxidoreductase [Nannocystis sp.]|nr:FAD-binding oxidoreductase [Nannocystis sp.]